jgi:hypothetical protein
MEEQQNNTDVQDTQANSGNGTPKVMKAGSEAKAGRRVLRSGASDSGNPAEGSDHATEEAARSIVRAGQQTLEGARAATYAAVDESTGNGKVLEECASFIKRATHRNAQALGDLMHCYTFPSLLQWQNHLLNATITDLWETNSRILRLVTHKA